MGVLSFLNRKKRDEPVVEVYANLDKLTQEPLAFELLGRVHKLKPILLGEYYQLANALANLHILKAKDKIEAEELLRGFHELIASVCETLSIDDVKQMSQAQVGALYTLICEHAVGRSYQLTQDDLKKKTFDNLTPSPI